MASFDKRIVRLITTSNSSNSSEASPINPFDGTAFSILGVLPNPEAIRNAPIDPKADKDVQSEIRKNNAAAADNANTLYEEYLKNPEFAGTNSLMNPYTITRLYGAFDSELKNYIFDSSTTRKYYEIDGDEVGGYAKNPTTAAIIKWGAGDAYNRTPYQFQDFVFCKYWNKIPNNRLITLRRYPNPILDNLNYPTMVDSENKTKSIMHPLATLVGYFGDETENKLSDILSFSTGMNWEEVKSDFWTVTGEQEGMDKVLKQFGGGSWVSQHATTLTNILGILNPDNFNASLPTHGLPPDPWTTGSYVNRIMGPVNVIDSVQRRQRGLKFTNDITLKFHYVARPINGINAKAALLDILANVLVLGSASAQFFGGAHKFMVKPDRYPFNVNPSLAKLYKGDLFNATHEMVNRFADQATSGNTDEKNGWNPSPIFKNMLSGLTEVLGDAMSVVKDIFNGNYNELTTKGGESRGSKGVAKVVGERMRENMGMYPYLTGLRSLFTGQPVGDWHLTIGNPLNPIAMIGNLVCDEVSVKFGDELGPDDFPLEFTATIKLKHGMPRDRDAIEAMFNRGAGRIYDISDEFSSSADFETAVDTGTGGKINNSIKNIKAKTTSGPFAKNLTILPGYAEGLNGQSIANKKWMSSSEDLNSISSLNSKEGKSDYVNSLHILAPWALKNIM